MVDTNKYTNRLIHEKSPYLLQHAHNPVDWYPWGEEAFRTAQDLDKPIFLSIGYASCHWCHNMAKESFQDPEIAKLLNESFINVKVDREELPEVDSMYMEFAQSMISGAAGWPLNVILTPELKPFFAATYLPPCRVEGLIGIKDLIHRIREVWSGEERERVVAQAEKIVEIFQDHLHATGTELPPREYIDVAAELYYKIADTLYGGIKGPPKFPVGYHNNFLLQYSYFFDDSRALFILELTLDMMQRGGIYDHLGGGFSRYTIDEQWLVPHFEKMLYDSALLSHAYLEAWKLTGKDLYREICSEVVRYVLENMTSQEGGFYSSQDADSEGHEGLYYTWTPEEVRTVLGEKNGTLACEFFGVTKEGNFEGRNILHTPNRVAEFAADKGMNRQKLQDQIAEIKQHLLTARSQRVHPSVDDKILTSWNGLMIYSIVETGFALGNRHYVDTGIKAAQFIKNHLWKNEKLLRRWRDGQSLFDGGLDDYAFLIRGLISLFEAGAGTEWLKWALELTSLLKKNFKAEGGAFYQLDEETPFLILRRCLFGDGAEPSGNAIHCENLLRLYRITYETEYLDQAEDILRAVKTSLNSFSPGYGYHILNLIRYYNHDAPTIVVALNKAGDCKEEIRKKIFSSFLPHKAVIWRDEADSELFSLLPHLRNQPPLKGKTTVYTCYNRICDNPLTDISEIEFR